MLEFVGFEHQIAPNQSFFEENTSNHLFRNALSTKNDGVSKMHVPNCPKYKSPAWPVGGTYVFFLGVFRPQWNVFWMFMFNITCSCDL